MKKQVICAIKFIFFFILVSFIILAFSYFGILINENTPAVNTAITSENITFIIDAGHGGEDGGAYANDVTEKDVNLNISLDLYNLLSISGVNVQLTRKTDTLLYKQGQENHKKRYDILNRVEFVNGFENPVFISIHQNKFEIAKYKGLQVYYSKNSKNSNILASIIQNNSKEYIDKTNKREIKQADFRIKVLDLLEVPAVLVECGFLSNPDEAKLLNDRNYQKKLAYMIYISILDYIKNTQF